MKINNLEIEVNKRRERNAHLGTTVTKHG